jgi:glycopeptide antibiotics resistance protein
MIAFLSVLFGLTLGGFYQPNAPRNFVPLRTMRQDVRLGGSEFLINSVGNVVVMLPMGLLLPSLIGRRCSALRVSAATLAVSLLIEMLQGLSRRRVADVDDVILNTLGGLIGFGLWSLARWAIRRRRRAWRSAGASG